MLHFELSLHPRRAIGRSFSFSLLILNRGVDIFRTSKGWTISIVPLCVCISTHKESNPFGLKNPLQARRWKIMGRLAVYKLREEK